MNSIDFQKEQAKKVQDTVILQKVNRVHREAFRQKFPGQAEHMLRLTAERLQAVLTQKPTDMANLDSWNCTPSELRDLAEALYWLNQITIFNPVEE